MEEASAFKRYQVLVAVCSTAIEASDAKFDAVLSSFEEFQRTGLIVGRIRVELEALTNRLDEEYFDYQDSGDEKLALQRFHQARAVAALAFAGDKSNRISALEAIYEAAAAVDNSQIIIEKVRSMFSI